MWAALAAAFLTTIGQRVLEILRKQRSVLFDEYYCNKKQQAGNRTDSGLLFRMALPSVLAQVVNLLYNMVDRAFVGASIEHGIFGFGRIGCVLPTTMIVTALQQLIGAGARRAASWGGALRKPNRFSASVLVCFAVFLWHFYCVSRVFCDPIGPFRCQCTDAPYARLFPAHLLVRFLS